MQKVIETKGLRLFVAHEVYTPREDSFMMVDELINEKLPLDYLMEIGPGTGIISLSLVTKKTTVLACDISIHAARQTNFNAFLNGFTNILVIASSLIRPFRRDAIPEVIIFNPPYLPEDPEIDPYSPEFELKQLVGGKEGFETVSQLLGSLVYKSHTIYTILSSLATNPVSFNKLHPQWKGRVIKALNMGFETIWLVRFGDID